MSVSLQTSPPHPWVFKLNSSALRRCVARETTFDKLSDKTELSNEITVTTKLRITETKAGETLASSKQYWLESYWSAVLAGRVAMLPSRNQSVRQGNVILPFFSP